MSMEGKNFFSKNWNLDDLDQGGTLEFTSEQKKYFWEEVFDLGIDGLNTTDQITQLKMILDEFKNIEKEELEDSSSSKDTKPTLGSIIKKISDTYGKQSAIAEIKNYIEHLEEENNESK